MKKTSSILSRIRLTHNGVRVRQSMAGRMRIQAAAIKDSEDSAQKAFWMQKFLQDKPGIISVETRVRTGSIIVRFQPEHTKAQDILEAVLTQVLWPESFAPDPGNSKGASELQSQCNCPPYRSSTSKKGRVLFLSGMMAYALARTWIFRMALAQNPLSLLGMAAMAGTIPLIKEAVQDTAEKKKITVKPFLAAGAVSTIFMGEAFSALQILWIYNVAEVTEDYVAQKSRNAIRNILEVTPANAYVMKDGMEVEISMEQIRPDDIVAVHTGEKLPVDGVIIDGDALVDEATINGRSEAIFKTIGDPVFAGTFISQGTLFVRTWKNPLPTRLRQNKKQMNLRQDF